MTNHALELLAAAKAGAYDRGLGVLREDTRAWWVSTLAQAPDEYDEGEEHYDADVAGLRRFSEDQGDVLV